MNLFKKKEAVSTLKADPIYLSCGKCGNSNALYTIPHDGKFKCDYCSYKIDIDKLEEKIGGGFSGFSGRSMMTGLSGFSGMPVGVPISFLMPVVPTIVIFVRNKSNKSVEVKLCDKLPQDILVKVLCKKNSKIMRSYDDFIDSIKKNTLICRIDRLTDDDTLDEIYREDIFEGKQEGNQDMLFMDGKTFIKLNLSPKQNFSISMIVTARQAESFTGF